jgi:hypothetical protein
MTTKEKTFVTKNVTVGVEDLTLKEVTAASKVVGAPTDVRFSTGGPVPKNEEGSEFHPYSVTFTWSEEV